MKLIGTCKEIQDAVDRGDKCELGETNRERLLRKERVEKENILREVN